MRPPVLQKRETPGQGGIQKREMAKPNSLIPKDEARWLANVP